MKSDGLDIGRKMSQAGKSQLKKIQRVNIEDRATSQYLERLSNAIDNITSVPFVNGIKVELRIDSNKATHLIRHGFGRRIEGWFPLRNTSAETKSVFETTPEDEKNHLLLDTSAVTEDFNLLIWIF